MKTKSNTSSNGQEHPAASATADSAQAQQLAMRVLKLRWMGMDTEADRIEAALSRVARGCTLLAGPFDTD